MKRNTARNLVRGGLFVLFGLLALQLWPGARELALALPAASPVVAAATALAGRGIEWLLLLSLPLAGLAFWRGRFFCAWICPLGWATEMAAWPRRKHAGFNARIPHLGVWLLLLTLGGAAAGYPLWIWLDPLAIFNGFFGALRHHADPVELALGAGFVAVLSLSIIWPQLWCRRVCPLGALQDLLILLRLRWDGSARAPTTGAQLLLGRRAFVTVLAGGAGGLLARLVAGRTEIEQRLIRPPGAQDDPLFAALCTRCGACGRACPERIIRPDTGRGGPGGLLAPRLDFAQGYCRESCRECTRVCPSGAIRRLDLPRKRTFAIGLARVTRSNCLNWRGENCLLCQRACPYDALRIGRTPPAEGPVVVAARCIGCGACERECPVDPRKAIEVVRRAR